jgi:predicted TIM-barrel fold metal-dependent hydrolase
LLGESFAAETYEAGVIEAVADRADEGGLDEDRFFEELNRALQDLETSDKDEDRELLHHLEKEAGLPKRDETLEAFPVDLARAIWKGGGAAVRYVKWIKLLSKYRFKITDRLIETYSKGEQTVDLFTPALVDYDRWVGDKAEADIPSQMALMEGNIRLHEGRIHPFLPVDPWREAYSSGANDSPMTWLQKAIDQHGFIGVKLYPPMGYSPSGNALHNSFPPNVPDTPDVFGRRLDDALEALYTFCAQDEIPVLAHCADSNEVQDTFGERANPAYWERVVLNHPSLRINLGHFGDLDTLSEDHGWAWKVGQLLNDTSTHVYADVSHHSAILEKESREKTIKGLERLFDKNPNAQDRIMFGTDWIMLARIKDHDRFLLDFRNAYKEAFGAEAVDKFMGSNAAQFLGLHSGNKTRQRLELFYDRYNIPAPEWIAAVGRGAGA